MHPISFQFKRAHLKCVAFGTEVVARIRGMTPATFDLMYAVHTNFGNHIVMRCGRVARNSVAQRDLWKQLGLHPSTISKMIKRLRELGWLENTEWDRLDGRTKVVRLTERGCRRIQRAMRIVFQQHTHAKLFEDWFKRNPKFKKGIVERMDDYWSNLKGLAKYLADTSKALYVVDYEPDPPAPVYVLLDHKRGARRWGRCVDRTSYGHLGKFAHTSDELCTAGTMPRSAKTRAFRGRCLATDYYTAARPETRIHILTLGTCEPDDLAYQRTLEREKQERIRELMLQGIDPDTHRYDPYIQGLAETLEREKRFREEGLAAFAAIPLDLALPPDDGP